MSLKTEIEAEIKKAMLAKEQIRLTALRSIKSLILLAETDKNASENLSSDTEIKLLTKAAKQRRESAEIFKQQNRLDLAEKEIAELSVIEEFLPKQLSESEISDKIKEIILSLGATTTADLGKVMGASSKQLSGLADNKMISEIVKKLLS